MVSGPRQNMLKFVENKNPPLNSREFIRITKPDKLIIFCPYFGSLLICEHVQ